MGDSLDEKQEPTRLDKNSFNKKEKDFKGVVTLKLTYTPALQCCYLLFKASKKGQAVNRGKRRNGEDDDDEEGWGESSTAEESDQPDSDVKSRVPQKRVRNSKASKAGQLLEMYKVTETRQVAEKKEDNLNR